MPINFPSSPSSGQLYTYDNKTWEYNGIYWEVYSALTSYVGGTGTTQTIPKWSNINTLVDSQITDDGNKVYVPVFSATTYENLPTDVFVYAGVYANGQITFTNTTGGTFSVTNIPIGGAGGQPYYLNLSVSQTPYQEFAASATTGSQQTTGVTIASGVTSTIANFLTPSGFPNISLIPAGYWSFYLHSYKANGSTTFDIFVEVYSRTTGGTETLLLSTDPTEVTSIGSASMEISDGYYSGSSLNLSDRILVKVRATNTGTASSTITFLTEGTVHYSYGVTPFTSAGAVTSVGLVVGTTGTDVNVSNSPITSSGNITLNIPDASATARGLVTTGTQTYAGVKTFSSAPNLSSLSSSQILALDGSSNIQSLTTATYPSLTELTYVKGVTSTIQTQLDNKFSTSGGTVSGNLTVTGTTSSDTVSATTYQNLPVSAVTNGTGISALTSNGTVTVTNTQVQGITGKTDGIGITSSISNNVITITNTDLGSSQNIFKNIQITGTTQFSAQSNSSDLNFSGVNISIFSASSNTLVFSAGTGGGGGTTVTGGTYSAGTLTLGNSTGGTVSVTGFPSTTSFGVTVDGSGGVITTGQKGYIRIPYAFTITSWTLIGSPSGSITFDIWRTNGAIPTVSNTIIGVGGTKPSLSTATYATSSTLTNWTITGATGDVIGWNVDSCTTTTTATLQLFVTRTQ